jgi:hypothetical protein
VLIKVHSSHPQKSAGETGIELNRCPIFFKGAVRIALLIESFSQF